MLLAFTLADQSRHAPLKQGDFLREELDGKHLWVYKRRYFTNSPADIAEFNKLADTLLRERDYTILVRAIPAPRLKLPQPAPVPADLPVPAPVATPTPDPVGHPGKPISPESPTKPAAKKAAKKASKPSLSRAKPTSTIPQGGSPQPVTPTGGASQQRSASTPQVRSSGTLPPPTATPAP